jgi:hypothetical protein
VFEFVHLRRNYSFYASPALSHTRRKEGIQDTLCDKAGELPCEVGVRISQKRRLCGNV